MPRRPRIFYGWVIVFGLVGVGVVSGGAGGATLGLFIKPMSEDLDLSQSFFGFAQTARIAGFAASGWLIGRLLDEHGARALLAIAGLLFGLSLIAMSFINAGWQIIVLFFISGLLGIQAAGGGGNLYSSVPISRWFIRKRGKAMSVAFLGIPLGIFIFSPLTPPMIDAFGWRGTWLVFGIGSAISLVLIALVLIRRDPTDMGLEPDGDPTPAGDTPHAVATARALRHAAEYSWSREQATRSTAFWRLTAVLGIRTLSLSTLGLFRIPYFIDQGVSEELVALALSAEAVTAILGAIPAGWAVDRFQPRFASGFALCLMMVTVVVTILAHEAWHVFAATTLFGFAIASSSVIETTIWPAYFGGQNIGSIRGTAIPITLVFGAIGSPLTGLTKDWTGSYIPAWIVGFIGLAISAAIILATPKPPRPEVEAGEAPAGAVP
jgi:MFS family permease